MIRKTLLCLIGIAMATSIYADHIGIDAARQIATSFCAQTGSTRSNSFGSRADVTLAAQSSGYYIFNYADEGGYVIIAANDVAAAQILGYSESGSFNPSTASGAFKAWLADADAQIAYGAANPDAVKSSAYTSAKSNPYRPTTFDINRPEVVPLVSAQWSQSSPYNQLCPLVNGVAPLAGCVPVAMSQVMYSFKYPEHGNGIVANSGQTVDLSKNLYNWSIMKDSYDANSTEESKDAVALLVRDAGFACKAQYSTSFTGSYTSEAASALVKYFGYDKGICDIKRQYFTKAEWQEIMYRELANGHPLMVAGYNKDEGHSFVCDGYRNGLFHYNFGWGYEKLYLLTDALEQSSMVTSDVTNSGYNRSQEIVIGIQPPRENESYGEIVFNSSAFRASATSVSRTDATASFTGSFTNGSLASSQEYTLGIMVEDEEGNPTFLEAPTTTTLNNRGTNSLTASLANFPAEDGTYLVYPACKGESGEWQLIHTSNGTQSHVIATAEDGTIKFSNPTGGEYDFSVSKITANNVMPDAGASVVFTTIFECTRGSYYGDSYVVFMQNGKIVSKSDNNPISLQEGESRQAKYNVTVPSTNGLYEVYIVDKSSTRRNSKPLYIYVGGKSLKATIKLTEPLTMESADAVDKESMKFHAKVTCTKNVYLGSFKIQVYDSKFKKLGVIESEQFAILTNDTADINIEGALTDAIDGGTYTAYITNRDGAYFNGQEDIDFVNFTVDPTGIESNLATCIADEPATVYNIAGQRILTNATLAQLMALPRGIYIVKTTTKSYKLKR